MKKTTVYAYAKINLGLDIIRRKPNGYHEVSMIMQQIDLKDRLDITELKQSGSKIEISSNNKKLPTDSSNIVYAAYKLLSKKYNIKASIGVYIEKNIPISAGLAGGSTDAAALIIGLNKLYDLKMSQGEMMKLALELGADVPFCILGGTALSQGIGEKLTPLKNFKDIPILLANPGISVSTQDTYNNLDLTNIKERPDIKQLISYIENKNTKSLAVEMKNVLETVTTVKHPEITKIKQDMINGGAMGSLMSGSGSTVFGIFDSVESRDRCRDKLRDSVETVIATTTK